jgi:Leucine-rich repeat (LRR) protein/predicted acylesterase/phospholipase RssA
MNPQEAQHPCGNSFNIYSMDPTLSARQSDGTKLQPENDSSDDVRRGSTVSPSSKNPHKSIRWDKVGSTFADNYHSIFQSQLNLPRKGSAPLSDCLKASFPDSWSLVTESEANAHPFIIQKLKGGMTAVEDSKTTLRLMFDERYLSRTSPAGPALKVTVVSQQDASSTFYFASNALNVATLVAGSVFDSPELQRGQPTNADPILSVVVKARGAKLSAHPAGIQMISSLKKLVLAGHEITDIPAACGEMQNLEQLDLSSNHFHNFPVALFQMRHLKFLSVRNNQIKLLPDKFEMLGNLEAFDAAHNAIAEIPETLLQLKKLTRLSLSHNKIHRVDGDPLVGTSELLEFYLSDTKIPVSLLKTMLTGFYALQTLALAHCRLTILPDEIGNCASLADLDLSSNNLKELPKTLFKLPKLARLLLPSNKFAVFPIPPNCESAKLETLNLANNHIVSLDKLPPLPSLRTLDLSDNAELKELSENIRQWKNLASLHLLNTQVHRVPLAISSMAYLSDLVLPDLRLNSGDAAEVSLKPVHKHERLPTGATLFLEGMRDAPHPLFLYSLAALLHEREFRDALVTSELDLVDLLFEYVKAPPLALSRMAIPPLRILAAYDQDVLLRTFEWGLWPILFKGMQMIEDPDYAFECAEFLALFCLFESTAKQLTEQGLLNDVVNGVLIAQDETIKTRMQEEMLKALARAALTTSGFAFLQSHPELPVLKGLRHSPSETVAAAAFIFCNCMGIHDLDRCVVEKRGVRILACDGGGTKGVVEIEMLRAIEQAAGGVPISQLFDVIVGTSTGSIVAHMCAATSLTIDQMHLHYYDVSRNVFGKDRKYNRNILNKIFRMLENREFAVYSAEALEDALFGIFGKVRDIRGFENSTSPQKPKVAAVASLVSSTPAVPFLFRSYSNGWKADGTRKESRYLGTTQGRLGLAMRASAAAPTFFPEVRTGSLKTGKQNIFQDGGLTANNPAAIALHEARCIYGDRPIDCVVSLGCGNFPVKYNVCSSQMLGRLQDTLIFSATEVQKTHAALEECLGDAYFRFDPENPTYADEIDEWRESALNTMRLCAVDYMTMPEQQEKLKQLGKILQR